MKTNTYFRDNKNQMCFEHIFGSSIYFCIKGQHAATIVLLRLTMVRSEMRENTNGKRKIQFSETQQNYLLLFAEK